MLEYRYPLPTQCLPPDRMLFPSREAVHKIKTNLDGETGVRGCVAYITGRNYVHSQTKREPVGGNDHRERATFGGGNGMLEFSNAAPNMERCVSSVRRIRGDPGEPGVHYDFHIVKSAKGREIRRRLAIDTSCEELVQSRREDDDSHVVL